MKPSQEILNELFASAPPQEKAKINYIPFKINEYLAIFDATEGNDKKNFSRDFRTVLRKKRKTKESPAQNYAFNLLSKAYYAMIREREGGKKKYNTQQHTSEDLF